MKPPKTSLEIHQHERAAEILYSALKELHPRMRAGYTGIHAQDFVCRYLSEHGVKPALRAYRGFPADISVSPNNIAAHGIPSNEAFQVGDIVTVDIVIRYNNAYADMAWTYAIEPISVYKRRLIAAAWQCTLRACQRLRHGLPLSAIARIVQTSAAEFGSRVVSECCGHGIGSELHEEPIVPFAESPSRAGTEPALSPTKPSEFTTHSSKYTSNKYTLSRNSLINIEPVLTLGTGQVQPCPDGISYSTTDYEACAQFEFTCHIQETSARIISLPHIDLRAHAGYPPFY